MGRKPIDETGNRYGRLLVVGRVEGITKDATWLCLCDCGNETQVKGAHLRRESGTRSCGCHRREQSTERIRAVAKQQIGELHPGWKATEVSYPALHIWVRNHKIKAGICSRCGAERWTEWANVGHQYSRNLDDYIEVCKPCHMRMDGHPWVRVRSEAT